MKILYIVPSINNEGGVASVLSTKSNYFVENLGYEIHILTQNKDNNPLFYAFNDKIVLHDMILKGNKVAFLLRYKKELKKHYQEINPDIIIVLDNGLKGYFVPLLLKTKKPIIFESHGSKFIEEHEQSNHFFSKAGTFIKLFLKEFGSRKFTKFVTLSNESLKEWKGINGIIIPNSLIINSEPKATLQSKKVIAVARHSYEKGLDRLLIIWQKIIEKHPDWILEIYGSKTENVDLEQLALDLKITAHVSFYNPVKNIEEKYKEATIAVMTSRSEGIGMVLLEAMACGLPCIAYDCPCGPRTVINDGINGFLIEDGSADLFVEKLLVLIENEAVRLKIGKNAQAIVTAFDFNKIMEQWKNLFESLVKNAD